MENKLTHSRQCSQKIVVSNDNLPIAKIHVGEALKVLETIPSNSVDLVVTSPPYYGNLRDYGHPDQYGCEPTLEMYLANQVRLFTEVYRVLKPTGNLWINIGDKLESKSGNLIGVPWKLAFALQEAGWILRNDIIWHKPNPVPESMKNRFSRQHEYFFHFTKTKKNFFDFEAVMVPPKTIGQKIYKRNPKIPTLKTAGGMADNAKYSAKRIAMREAGLPELVRRKSVWTVNVQQNNSRKFNHNATYPEELIEPVVLSSCPVGGRVLDPYGGSGTTVVVAQKYRRHGHMIELNPDYAKTAKKRIEDNGYTAYLMNFNKMSSAA